MIVCRARSDIHIGLFSSRDRRQSLSDILDKLPLTLTFKFEIASKGTDSLLQTSRQRQSWTSKEAKPASRHRCHAAQGAQERRERHGAPPVDEPGADGGARDGDAELTCGDDREKVLHVAATTLAGDAAPKDAAVVVEVADAALADGAVQRP